MNYTSVVLGGVLTLALTYFYVPVYGGVHWFKGPVRTTSGVAVGDSHEIKALDELREDSRVEMYGGDGHRENPASIVV